jgi:hypothetical protein
VSPKPRFWFLPPVSWHSIPEAARVYISGNILAELLLLVVVVVVIVVVKSRSVAVSGPTPSNRNTTSPLVTPLTSHIRPGERLRVCATLKQQTLALHTQIYTRGILNKTRLTAVRTYSYDDESIQKGNSQGGRHEGQVQRKRGARARNGIATFVLCVPLSNIWTLIVSILTRVISVVSS